MALEALQYERYLVEGIAPFFVGRIRKALTDSFQVCTASAPRWEIAPPFGSGDGKAKIPTGYTHLAIYSKRSFAFPHFFCRLSLDGALNNVGAGDHFFFGLENGSNSGPGIATWYYRNTGVADQLMVRVGGYDGGQDVDMNWARRSDYATTLHTYEIVVHGAGIEFYLDKILRLYVVNASTDATITTGILGPPYKIITIQGPNPYSYMTLWEFSLGAARASELGESLDPYWFRCVEGRAFTPPRIFPLYVSQTNTRWNARSIPASTTELSNYVPLIGWRKKVLVLDVTAVAGDTWTIEYVSPDGSTHTKTIAPAVGLNFFPLDDGPPICRFKVQTDGTGTTITDAWVSCEP